MPARTWLITRVERPSRGRMLPLTLKRSRQRGYRFVGNEAVPCGDRGSAMNLSRVGSPAWLASRGVRVTRMCFSPAG